MKRCLKDKILIKNIKILYPIKLHAIDVFFFNFDWFYDFMSSRKNYSHYNFNVIIDWMIFVNKYKNKEYNFF